MPISRDVSRVPLRNSVSPRAMSLPAKPMNWPGGAALNTSMAGPCAVSSKSVCSIMITASAPRGIMPPVAIVVAVPGVTSPRGRTAASDDFRIEGQPARRLLGRAGGIGGAHGKSVDPGSIERRDIDRRAQIVRQDPTEPCGQRDGLAALRAEIDRGGKARMRFVRRHDFQKLLLARGLAHGGEQGRRCCCVAQCTHSGFTGTGVPGAKPSCCAGTRT